MDLKDRQILLIYNSQDFFEKDITFSQLASFLQATQKTIYETAEFIASEEKLELDQNQIRDEIKEYCQLTRVLEEKCCYALVGEMSPAHSIGPITDIGKAALQKLREILASLISDDPYTEIEEILPSPIWRNRILQKLKPIVPAEKDKWQVSIAINNRENIFVLNPGIKKVISRIIPTKAQEMVTLQGELKRLSLDERKMGILLEGEKKIVPVSYPEEFEDTLKNSLGKIVRIVGDVEYGHDGLVKKMKSLSNVSEPEKFYIEMKEISFDGRVLQSRDKLRFEPFYDSDIHMMAIRDPEFRMFVSGNTKEELQKEIEEVIAFLWEEYALEEDKNLTPGAIDLKNKLLDTFKEGSQN